MRIVEQNFKLKPMASSARSLALACALALGVALPLPAPALAADAGRLDEEYQVALEAYQQVIERQAANALDLERNEADIDAVTAQIAQSREAVAELLAESYKNDARPGKVLDMMLNAESFNEALALSDSYSHLSKALSERVDALRAEQSDLEQRRAELAEQRELIDAEAAEARKQAAAAKRALRRAAHLDGAKYHQVQGNSSNCGATSFIVGVNTLLGKNRFKDNVAVWKSEAFGCDSTQGLVKKGTAWLADHGLSDKIEMRDVPGDIHKARQLRDELERGNVVVISSGPNSEWQHADGSPGVTGDHAAGHWIVFYAYKDGVFFANDSSRMAISGAGCPYTTKQMQQWLDGRSYHLACVMSRK